MSSFSEPAPRGCSRRPKPAGAAAGWPCSNAQPSRAGRSHLRRRPVQLHEYLLSPREFSLGQPALRAFGAGALHAGRLHRPRGAPRDPLSREDARAALLRWVSHRDPRDAAGRVRVGGGGDSHRVHGAGCSAAGCSGAGCSGARVQRAGVQGADLTRCIRCAALDRRHRRPLDSKARRDGSRLSHRARLRHRRRPAAPRARAARVRRRRSRPMDGSGRRRDDGGRVGRRRRHSASGCSSRIAGSAVRPSSRRRLTGSPGRPWRSISCPTSISCASSRIAARRVTRRRRRRRWASGCHAASRIAGSR